MLSIISTSDKGARTCFRCEQLREDIYFPDDSDMCKACHLHETFQYIVCSACRKPHLEKATHCGNIDEKRQVCNTCAHRDDLYKCTVCHEAKSAEEFRAHKRDLMRKFHRRCKRCERCEDCGRHYPDFRMFAVDSCKCVKCTGAQATYVPGMQHAETRVRLSRWQHLSLDVVYTQG